MSVQFLPEDVELSDVARVRLDEFVRLEVDKIAQWCTASAWPGPICAMAFDTYADGESAPVVTDTYWLPAEVRNAPFVAGDIDAGLRRLWWPAEWPIEWQGEGWDRNVDLSYEVKTAVSHAGCWDPDRVIFNAIARAAARRDWLGSLPATDDFLCLTGLGLDEDDLENRLATQPPERLAEYWKRGWLRWPSELQALPPYSPSGSH
jgi:hypothetical protein